MFNQYISSKHYTTSQLPLPMPDDFLDDTLVAQDLQAGSLPTGTGTHVRSLASKSAMY